MIAIFITIFTAVAVFFIGKRGKKIPGKLLACIIGLEIVGSLISLTSGSGNAVVKKLRRPEAAGATAHRDIKARSGEKEEEVDISISARRLSDKESERKLKQAEREIKETYLGENESSETVYRDLLLGSRYQGSVSAEWEISPQGIFDSEGKIYNSAVESPTEVRLRGLLSCQDRSSLIELTVKAVPVPPDADMGFSYYLSKALDAADAADPEGSYLVLPETINGRSVSFTEKQEDEGLKLTILMAFAAGLYYFYITFRARDLEKARQKEVSLDYPKMVSALSMYIGAGFSVRQAFEQVGRAYQISVARGHPRRPAYEALLQMNRSIRDGEDEENAINAFGDSLRNKGFRKLSMMLAQCRRKGNGELRDQMEQEEREAMEKRRMDARIAGEEASVKLLLPMIGLLGVIFIALMIPAFMQMQ